MTNQILYLRPKSVAYIRRFGGGRDAAVRAWDDLKEALRETQQEDLVEAAFGMIRGSRYMDPDVVEGRGNEVGQVTYDACVEVVPGFRVAHHVGLRTQTLRGGSYVRRRLSSGIAAIPREFEAACAAVRTDTDLVLDDNRPLVEIYMLDGPGVFKPHRIELCIPVAPRTSDHPSINFSA